MERLFYFLYRYRAFFTFLALEVFCSWLIIENNQFQGAKFFNSSNSFVAGLNNFSQGVREYFSLRETNRLLAEENAALRNSLEQRSHISLADSLGQKIDSALIKRFEFVSAKVVNNSVHRFTNFLTIDKGYSDSIKSGMAVISSTGIVGKVKTVSKHYSVVTSLLNKDVMVSAILKRTGHYGTIQWNGQDADFVQFNFVPRHVNPKKGDTIVTSGFNAVFPRGLMIGTIDEVSLADAALFYDLNVKLSQDFRKLTYVEVVKSNLKMEQDSLELSVEKMNR
ncbi:MAG TPA: rod shape-determining protein MreC [Cyclobacteriaceae bacterium]